MGAVEQPDAQRKQNDGHERGYNALRSRIYAPENGLRPHTEVRPGDPEPEKAFERQAEHAAPEVRRGSFVYDQTDRLPIRHAAAKKHPRRAESRQNRPVVGQQRVAREKGDAHAENRAGQHRAFSVADERSAHAPTV